MVMKDGTSASREMADEESDGKKLMETLKFGCNAVFGGNAEKNNKLPTQNDIDIITDRLRTEDFSSGALKGGVATTADDFDAEKEFTSTTEFAGIDFKAIREKHKESKIKSLGEIQNMWRAKRERKNRITMVSGKGTGYGKSVPVLAANVYSLQEGERSVFQRELKGQGKELPAKKTKQEPTFKWQDHCQFCGDGGFVVCCPRCPVSLHVECAGMNDANEFSHCSHHKCTVCHRATSHCGGFLFPCSICTHSFCEDHLPVGAKFLETCERMENLGHRIKHGVYIHCSTQCENVAIQEVGYDPMNAKSQPCPPPLDLADAFGGVVDENLLVPYDPIVVGKRRRNKVNYAQSKSMHRLIDSNKGSTSLKYKGTESTGLATEGNAVSNEAKRQKVGAVCNEGALFIDLTDSKSNEAFADHKLVPHAAVSKDPRVLPGETTRKKSVAKLDDPKPPEYVNNEYDALAPITPSGLLLYFSCKNGYAYFDGYKKTTAGLPGPAETSRIFLGKDRLAAVDGVSCEGKPFDQIIEMLKASNGKDYKELRMKPVYSNSQLRVVAI
jgi:hypothetical protein